MYVKALGKGRNAPTVQISLPKALILLDTGFHYVAHAGLEFTILLPQHPECWDYRRETLYLFKVLILRVTLQMNSSKDHLLINKDYY
jgi:hypothetical protein